MLILFDIDMTLLETDHLGIALLEAAGRKVFKTEFTAEGIVFGGGLDPNIISDMLSNNAQQITNDNIKALRHHYHQGLIELAAKQSIARALPGAHELVNASREHPGTLAIGVLTGNFPETGAIKLTSAGFNTEHFTVNAWGDSSKHLSPHRSHLPPVAIETFKAAKQQHIEPEQVIIIGDTIHDVTCALDNNCRSLAVATGHATRKELEDAGAHLVVDDLTQTQELLEWIMSTQAIR